MRALITGATSGIGLAFAEELAEQGADLVIVARTTPRLADLAQRLGSEHGVAVEVLTADLGDDGGCRAVMDRLAAGTEPVDVLVNNAGFGLNQPFVAGSLAHEEHLLDVLVRATLRLTHAALPGMVERGRGAVINVSSVAGWTSLGTYAAAKSWVTVFTESLGAELSGTGVTATAVCPGMTHTEFHDRAQMNMTALPAWAWLDARRVAREGLAAARAGRTISVPSKRYSMLALAAQYTPRPLLRQAGRLVPRPRSTDR
ncbi:MAG: SDR family oxidoreductase [Candidatus Nanopelagicales bacterium]